MLLLQDFIKTDNGQRPSLRQKIEQHVFFSNPTVADIVELLVELSTTIENDKHALSEEALTLVIDGFRKALQIDAVDASTNFFASGGGSLQVLLLQDFIKTDNGQRPSLRQKIEQHVFFSNPTVADIVELLVELASKFTDGANQSEAVSVQAGHVNSGGLYPASFQQEQMFILDASGFGAAYNMPWILDIKGKLNRELMLQALDLVVKREQPLRTILRLKGGNVQQKVLPKSDSRQLWECHDHFAGSYEDAIQILSEEQGYIFNVKQAPISRMNIVKLESDRSLVMVNGHHVNHDTVSIFIIFCYKCHF